MICICLIFFFEFEIWKQLTRSYFTSWVHRNFLYVYYHKIRTLAILPPAQRSSWAGVGFYFINGCSRSYCKYQTNYDSLCRYNVRSSLSTCQDIIVQFFELNKNVHDEQVLSFNLNNNPINKYMTVEQAFLCSVWLSLWSKYGCNQISDKEPWFRDNEIWLLILA